MAKSALKVVQDDAAQEPGIVHLGNGKLRVTFDIPEFAMVTIRKDRQIKVEFDQYTLEGLAQHFMKGLRFYNDEAGAAGYVEKLASGTTYYNKDGKPYKNRDDFLDACKAYALKAYDKIRLGRGNEHTRETIGDPVERVMLKLGFQQFALKGWTINNCPTTPGGKEVTKCLDGDGKPSYQVFKTRVEAFVEKFDKVFRPQAEAALAMQAEMEREIAEAAQEVAV